MSPAKLPIDVPPAEMKVMGMNLIPFLAWIHRIMPDSWRKSAMSKQNAPDISDLAKDLHDFNGESPYKTEEVVPDKVWSVTYTFEDKSMCNEKAREMMAAFGMDLRSEEFKNKVLEGAGSHGPEYVDLCKKDLENMLEYYNKTEYTDEEVRKTFNEELCMFVVKLNSGSLLLYSPVKIREEHGFKSWLDGLGKVEYIIVGSCFHTNYLSGVFKQYPEAKIVGTPAAHDKLNVIQALPRNLDKFDVNCQDADQLAGVNRELEKQGVTLFYVDGDVACNSLNAVAHNTLLTVDLIYGSHDGFGAFGLNKEEFVKRGVELSNTRLFRFRLMSKPHSPNGALAQYRYHMLDLNSAGAMSYDIPASDGSSCNLMAESLRYLLRLEFDTVLGVHCGRMTREVFRKDVEANWNWLDGKTLL